MSKSLHLLLSLDSLFTHCFALSIFSNLDPWSLMTWSFDFLKALPYSAAMILLLFFFLYENAISERNTSCNIWKDVSFILSGGLVGICWTINIQQKKKAWNFHYWKNQVVKCLNSEDQHHFLLIRLDPLQLVIKWIK